MAVYTTIDDPTAYFQTTLYTGDDSTSHAITNGGNSDLQADWLWLKPRTKVDNHRWMDSVRGVTKMSPSNSSGAEETISAGLASFDSNGFTLNTTDSGYNSSSYTYVAWCWKETADAGFDIISYTGNGSVRNLSHSLSAVPEFITVKNREATGGWVTYHHKMSSAPETDYLMLNNTAAVADYADYWNDTAPTSSVFSVGDRLENNYSSENIIAYAFAPKQGFSKFGTYEGNGNADGTFVYLGFRPAFVMTKSVDSTSAWEMFDNKREGYNVDNDALVANATTVEATADQIDLLSNGFKLRIATDPNVAETYIYMAFAEAPFVNSNGVPCNAR